MFGKTIISWACQEGVSEDEHNERTFKRVQETTKN